MIKCITEITKGRENNSIVYIGDHKTDIECAHNANKKLGNNRVVSVLLNYSNHIDWNEWKVKPDYIANSSEDIPDIVSILINS